MYNLNGRFKNKKGGKMKKILVIVMIILGGLGTNATFGKESRGYKYENEDLIRARNLIRAGEKALDSQEKQLKNLNQDINDYIQEITKDGRVTEKEMLILKRKVEEFKKEKKKANNYLKIYGVTTKTRIETLITKLVDEYEKGFIRHRDEHGKVRQLFAYLTGKDIEVEERIDWANLWFLFGLFLIVSCCFCMSLLKDKDRWKI